MILQINTDSPVWYLADKAALRLFLHMVSLADSADIPYHEKYEPLYDVLQKEGYIVVDDDYYVHVTDERGLLLCNHVSPFTNELTDLKGMRDNYAKRRVKKSDILDLGTQAVTLLENPKKIKGPAEVMLIWKALYALTYNNEYRDFTGKEAGQFKHLIRFYGEVNAVKLVVLYLMEATSPNIGDLLLKKDKYYHRFTTKEESHAEKESPGSGDGFY